MTERDYAIRSFKEVTLNAARHTEERMNLYYGKIKELMNNYQDLILENQLVLDELEQECQEKINENMAYALQYMDAYDYRMNLGKLKKEVNNIILIYGLCDMVNRAMTLVKYFTPNVGSEYYDVLYGCFCRHRKMTDMANNRLLLLPLPFYVWQYKVKGKNAKSPEYWNKFVWESAEYY